MVKPIIQINKIDVIKLIRLINSNLSIPMFIKNIGMVAQNPAINNTPRHLKTVSLRNDVIGN